MKDQRNDVLHGVVGKYADGDPASYVAVAVRIFVDGAQITEERLMLPEQEFEKLLREIADRHVRLIQQRGSMVFMVEFEFLDEPENQRFLRFGTDPRCMVQPMAINLDDMKGDA